MSKNIEKENNKNEKKKVSNIDLQDNRIIYLDGEIDDKCARETIQTLLKMDLCNKKDIIMMINSGGGSVSSGLAIVDAMNIVKSKIRTIAIGKCASTASIILISGEKGKRYIMPHAEVMIHEVFSGIFGKVTEATQYLDHSKTLNTKLRKIIVDKTKMNWKEVKENTINKDKWFNAKEAVKYGFADKII